MRKYLLAVALLFAVPSFAQQPPAERTLRPGVAALKPEVRDSVAAGQPAPAPKVDPGDVKEPKDVDAFVKLLVVTSNAIKSAVSLGTLAAVALAALAATYLLMFLAKSALKLALSEEYKKLLRAALTVLTLISTILGFLVMGVPGAVVAGLGSAAASPVHDALDGVRSLKNLKTAKTS